MIPTGKDRVLAAESKAPLREEDLPVSVKLPGESSLSKSEADPPQLSVGAASAGNDKNHNDTVSEKVGRRQCSK